jgi:hypothetical protein
MDETVMEVKEVGEGQVLKGSCPLVLKKITFLPRSTFDSFPMKGLKITEVNDFKVQSESALVWLTDRYLSKSMVNFIEMFKKEYSANLSHVE